MFKDWSTFVVVLSALSYVASSSCPEIVTRSQWGAAPALTRSLKTYPSTHVVLHHSSTPTCTSPPNCQALVRSIQRIHMTRRNYRDIGYNFLIGEDGNIYEGVGWGKEGTHADNWNSKSIGICIIGEYTSRAPNEAAQSAVKRLIECGVNLGHIDSGYKLLGHRQLDQTECPGSKLYQRLLQWTSWVPSA